MQGLACLAREGDARGIACVARRRSVQAAGGRGQRVAREGHGVGRGAPWWVPLGLRVAGVGHLGGDLNQGRLPKKSCAGARCGGHQGGGRHGGGGGGPGLGRGPPWRGLRHGRSRRVRPAPDRAACGARANGLQVPQAQRVPLSRRRRCAPPARIGATHPVCRRHAARPRCARHKRAHRRASPHTRRLSAPAAFPLRENPSRPAPAAGCCAERQKTAPRSAWRPRRSRWRSTRPPAAL
jgi:hypothetical protein